MKVFVDGKTALELIAQGLKKSTAYRAVKRGYYIPDYHQKKVVVGDIESSFFVSGECYRLAWAVYHRNFWRYPYHAEDLVQEAVLRLLELSGMPAFNDPPWRYRVVVIAMSDYLKMKIYRQGGRYRKDDSYQFSIQDGLNGDNKELWQALLVGLDTTERKEVEKYINNRRKTLTATVKAKILNLLAHEQTGSRVKEEKNDSCEFVVSKVRD